MGSKVSIDKHVSSLEDILEMSPAYFSSKLKFENKIPESITQHIKIWRYYEEDKKTKIIKSAPMSLQAIQSSNFTFVSNECYLVLFVYKKGAEENSPLMNFPHSMWGVVESYSNLTPRGLEVPVASSESLTNLNKEVLESFLLPRRPVKKEEGKFEYMIFVWNGKTSSPLAKSVALSAAFEFDSFINKAKEPLLNVLFSGGVIRNKKLQKGTILQMNSAMNKDINKELDNKFDNVKDSIYLLKFLFPNPEHKHQAFLFNERFLQGGDSSNHEDQFIPIGEYVEAENEEYNHHNASSQEYQDDGGSYASQDDDVALNSDRKNPFPAQINGPKINNLTIPPRGNLNEAENSEASKRKGPAIPSLSLGNPRVNPLSIPEQRNFVPTSHSSEGEQVGSGSSEHSHNDQPSPEKSQDMEQPEHRIKPNSGIGINFTSIYKENNEQPKTYEELLQWVKDGRGHLVKESVQKKLKIDHFSNMCSEVIENFLYVSGEKVAGDEAILESKGITHVVNAAADVCPDFFPEKLTYLNYHLKDAKHELIEAIFYEVISFIEETKKSNGRVLIHCAQGVSRSVTLCIAYIIFAYKKTYFEAEEHLKKARPVANPNIGFIAQLMNFEKRLHHPFNSLNIYPRIFCVGSHQIETPQNLVTRMLPDSFYDQKSKKKLDPRSIFVIQTANQLYKWVGNEIFEANLSRYMEKIDEHINVLQTYEHAPQNVVTVHAGNEPLEFWKIWNRNPDNNDYQYSKEWDNWFCDLSDKKNVEGPTINKEDEFHENDHEEEANEEEYDDDVPVPRPKLYIYPSLDSTTSIDGDLLADSEFLILCAYKSKHRVAYLWKGSSVSLSKADEEDYIQNVLNKEWSDVEPESIKLITEEPDNESDDFMIYFDF